MGTAESYGVGMTFKYHEQALFDLYRVSGRYEKAVSLTTWRWVTACASTLYPGANGR
ncbi:hypothetical protein [Streptomyces sp. 8K308]|uniref:hypothetical protein n=1 Tax=Streptomyces sp. 8K308 TaxID=2530388 RepID=UPI001404283D|nr:hypothetical protein [Streptomyces sp. 8K308]